MRKNSVLFLLFVSLQFFAQTYHFDFVQEYLLHNRKITEAINSEDSSYNLRFDNVNGKTFAYILDVDREMEHRFEVVSSDFPLTSASFKYQSSQKMNNLKKQKNDEIEHNFISFEKKNEANGEEIFIIKKLASAKSKRSKLTYEATLVPFTNDLASSGLATAFDFLGFKERNTLAQNYILKKLVSEDHKEEILKLNYFQPQNFDLTISL